MPYGHVKQRCLVGDDVVIAAGAECLVSNAVTGLQAVLSSDIFGQTEIDNPVISDDDGFVDFYAPPGRYNLQITHPDGSIIIRDYLVIDPDANSQFNPDYPGRPILNIGYDEYWDDVVLLIRGDGLSGSTNISGADLKGLNTINRNGSQAVFSNAQSRFGGTSIYCPGTTGGATSGASLTFPAGSYEVSNSLYPDFTIDCWVYLTEVPSGGGIFAHNWAHLGDSIPFALGAGTDPISAGGDHPFFGAFFPNVWNVIVDPSSFPINQWVHLSAGRSAANGMFLYVNGILVASLFEYIPLPTDGNPVLFHKWDTSGTNPAPQMYINDLRYTRADRRQGAASFELPTYYYPARGYP